MEFLVNKLFKLDTIFGEEHPPQPTPYWRCRCGSMKVEFKEQPRYCFDCHCQSCVACASFCNDNIPSGTSALSECGGVKKAFFYCRDCVLPADAANKVYWIRVTAEGTNFRSSTKCCNTLMTTASLGPVAMRPFNRNGLYNFDGSRFEPPRLYRGQCKYAAEPASIPEPRSDDMPPDFLTCLMTAAVMAPSDDDPAWLPPGPIIDVTIPKTWDDPE